MNGGPNAPTTADYAQDTANRSLRRVVRIEDVLRQLLKVLDQKQIGPWSKVEREVIQSWRDLLDKRW